MSFSRLNLICLFLHISLTSEAQDVVITLTAKNFGAPVELDSILLENIDNGSHLMLNYLPPDFNSYDINLSHGTIINGLEESSTMDFGFYQYINKPGMLSFYAKFPQDRLLTLVHYDVTGKFLCEHLLISRPGVSLITYPIRGSFAGIVAVESQNYHQSFKVVGDGVADGPMIPFIESTFSNKNLMKNSIMLLSRNNAFIFFPGDSVRFTVYRADMYTQYEACRPYQGDSLILPVTGMCPGTPFLMDFDGNLYTTVQIGGQCWMRENMKSIHYSSGEPLVDGTGIGYLSSDDTTKYWFNLNDDSLNVAFYGHLYTEAAALNGTNRSGAEIVQGICPSGWHVPSDEEWKLLEIFLGMSQSQADGINEWRGSDEGGKLKETGITHWELPNLGATNESGFIALPGGARTHEGYWLSMPYRGYWWTATRFDSDNLFYYRGLGYEYSTIYRMVISISEGFSVRCLKN
jgi:uncharacterized protein (TIGR02145 family)